MAPSKNTAKSKTQKPAAKAGPPRATVIAAAAPAADPACPLPPKAKTHVVLLDDDAKVGDRVMCENDHLLVVTHLGPPQFVKA
jgi:hypothetical protein